MKCMDIPDYQNMIITMLLEKLKTNIYQNIINIIYNP